MPALGAARMEQEIVKIPEHEIGVALGGAQAAVARAADFEKNLSIQQHGKQVDPGKTLAPTQLFDSLRRRQRGQERCNPRIANSEQRARAR